MEENKEKNWNDLSEELKKNVISRLGYKDRCSLQKCSKTDHSLVSTTPLPLLRLIIVLHQVHIRLHFFQPTDLPMYIHYWRHEMCCKQKLIFPGSMKVKVYRDGTWVGMGLRDLRCLLKMPGLEVEELVVTCKDGGNWERLKGVLEDVGNLNQKKKKKINANSLRFFGDSCHEPFFREHIDFGEYHFERLHRNNY